MGQTGRLQTRRQAARALACVCVRVYANGGGILTSMGVMKKSRSVSSAILSSGWPVALAMNWFSSFFV